MTDKTPMKCVVCGDSIKFGKLCFRRTCLEKYKEYLRPRPEHERLEHDVARTKYAQSDRVATEDEPKVRSKPTK